MFERSTPFSPVAMGSVMAESTGDTSCGIRTLALGLDHNPVRQAPGVVVAVPHSSPDSVPVNYNRESHEEGRRRQNLRPAPRPRSHSGRELMAQDNVPMGIED